GRHVAAVTPDRSNFHPAQCLPHGLAGADRAFRSDHLAVPRDDALGNRGHVLIDATAHPAQDGEAEREDDSQREPQPLPPPPPLESSENSTTTDRGPTR